MKRQNLSLLATLPAIALLAGALWAGGAAADVACSVPMTDWQPRDAVAQLAVDNGWEVRRIKIDDGCYEIIGTDAQGRKVKAKVHPATLEILNRDLHDDDDRPRRKGKH